MPNSYVRHYSASQAANNFIEKLSQRVFSEHLILYPLFVTKSIDPSIYKIDFFSRNVNFYVLRNFFFRKKSNIVSNVLLMFFDTFLGIRFFIKNKNYTDLWFYNLTPHNFLLALFLKSFFNRKCYVILADFNPSDSYLSIWYYIKFVIRKMDGIICLSEYSKSYFNHINSYVIAGVSAPKSNFSNIKAYSEINFENFMFSGRLSDINGISLLLNTFSNLPDKKLYISGCGELENLVLQFSNKYENIFYLGNLPYEQYLECLTKIDIHFSLRDPQFYENLFNFPSKIFEYLYYSKIVISSVKYEHLLNSVLQCEFSQDSLYLFIKNFNHINFGIGAYENLIGDRIGVLNSISLSNWMEIVSKIECFENAK